jgi:type IV secretion system protein VirB2
LDTARESGLRSRHIAANWPLEVPMNILPNLSTRRQSLRRLLARLSITTVLIAFPALAVAQSSSPFDSGLTSLQNLFTGTIAKVASLIAIVIGGYQFAHGEPGAKKTLAGVAAGTGIAVMAVNVLNWLWGI